MKQISERVERYHGERRGAGASRGALRRGAATVVHARRRAAPVEHRPARALVPGGCAG